MGTLMDSLEEDKKDLKELECVQRKKIMLVQVLEHKCD